MKYLLLVLVLVGCATAPLPTIVPPSKVVHIAPSVLESCTLLDENPLVSTFEDVLVLYSELATAYGVCADKQSNSIKLLKEFGNIK